MPFVNPFRKITCSFCGHQFHISQARWRDQRAPAEIIKKGHWKEVFPNVKDLPHRLLNDPVFRRDVGPLWLFGLQRFWIAENDMDQWIKICPKCLIPLSRRQAAGFASSNMVHIIGGPDAGKSHFIWALIREALSGVEELELTAGLDDTVNPDLASEMEQELWDPLSGYEVWKKVFDETLANGQTLKKTEDLEFITPLVLRLRTRHFSFWNRLFRPWDHLRPIDIIFHDRAGELYEKAKHNRQMGAASAFIFLFDSQKDPGQVLQEVYQGLVDAHQAKDNRLMSNDVAIVLTKADRFRRELKEGNPGGPWVHPPKYDRGYDRLEAEAISKDIKQYMRSTNLAGVVNQCKNMFANVRYFACSALGSEPVDHKILEPLSPYRVLDPLLWLLSRQGYIPIASEPVASRSSDNAEQFSNSTYGEDEAP